MLLNPARDHHMIQTIPGTRFLAHDLGLTGFQFVDLKDPHRIWTLQYLLSPVPGRAIGGIRARFMDNKGFVSYCNQRDLEVILGYGEPGKKCHWLDGTYPDIGDRDWYGLCVDSDDLLDDLYDRELRLRQQFQGLHLPTNAEITRLTYDDGVNSEELLTLIGDMDFETGESPDYRFETLRRRWAHIQRTRLEWVCV